MSSQAHMQPKFKFGDKVKFIHGEVIFDVDDIRVCRLTGEYIYRSPGNGSFGEDVLELYVEPKKKQIFAYTRRVRLNGKDIGPFFDTQYQGEAVRFFSDLDVDNLKEWKRAPEFDIVYPEQK
jgi:hypothetical protein